MSIFPKTDSGRAVLILAASFKAVCEKIGGMAKSAASRWTRPTFRRDGPSP